MAVPTVLPQRDAVMPMPTARQEAFCVKFLETRQVTEAYLAAYGDGGGLLTPRQLQARAQATYRLPAVRYRMHELMTEAAGPVIFSVQEALQRWLDIAFADPNELISYKIGACRRCHGEAHGYQWREHEYLDRLALAETASEALPDPSGGFGYDATREPHPDCPACHGEGVGRIVAQDTENLSPTARLLYGGVKHTAHGPQILIADRVKALENACRIIGAFDDKVTLNANVKQMVAVVTDEKMDPKAAAEAYRRMIAGISAG